MGGRLGVGIRHYGFALLTLFAVVVVGRGYLGRLVSLLLRS